MAAPFFIMVFCAEGHGDSRTGASSGLMEIHQARERGVLRKHGLDFIRPLERFMDGAFVCNCQQTRALVRVKVAFKVDRSGESVDLVTVFAVREVAFPMINID